MKEINGGITAPQGFLAAGVKAGIKKSGKTDLALIISQKPAAAAAVFTTNLFAAAPVLVSRAAVKGGIITAIVANAGCANACTGDQGMVDAKNMATLTAEALKVSADQVIVASTGVIGVTLPMEKVAAGITQAAVELSADGGDSAMQAIMTTDTFEKLCAYEFTLGGNIVRIGAMAKGAGMIHPNMATMLAFITTDAAIDPLLLDQALRAANDKSFSMVSVDGDTSTNDMACILANGLAGNPIITDSSSDEYKAFAEVLEAICIKLAKMVAKDGEGATKFLEITVRGATDFANAKQAAMAVANSPLVKTAFFGEDPNWGRILCAVGYSGIQADPAKTTLTISGIPIVKAGQGAAYDEKALRDIMAGTSIDVDINLGGGPGTATVWTCDFSYEYVKINGEYHT